MALATVALALAACGSSRGNQAGPDAAAPDASAAVTVCGETRGLKAGAAWPQEYACPTNAGRSRFLGPQSGATKLGPVTMDSGQTGIIVGANDEVMFAVYSVATSAFNAATGVRLWGATTPGSRPHLALGFDDALYVGSDHGVFYCVDAVTGALRWQLQLAGSFGAPVVAAPGTLYFAADTYGVYSLDTMAVWQKWHFDVPGGGQPAAPAVGNGRVYVVDLLASHLFALDAETGAKIFDVAIAGSAVGAPVLGLDAVYVATKTHGLAAFDPTSGALLWQQPPTTVATMQPALLANGNLVSSTAAGDGFVLDRSGHAISMFALGGTVSAAPIVAADDTAFFSTSNGVVAISPLDGSIAWQSTLKGKIVLGDRSIVVIPIEGEFAVIGP